VAIELNKGVKVMELTEEEEGLGKELAEAGDKLDEAKRC